METANVLISSLYPCKFMPCHQVAPLAMCDECVLRCCFYFCFCCPDAHDKLASGLGCRKLLQMASSCCGPWWTPFPTGRRLRKAQPSSSSTSCQATSGSLPTWRTPSPSCTSQHLAAGGCGQPAAAHAGAPAVCPSGRQAAAAGHPGAAASRGALLWLRLLSQLQMHMTLYVIQEACFHKFACVQHTARRNECVDKHACRAVC